MAENGKRDLLIIGCSQAKRPVPGPAAEVYDGPLFRTLRRRLPEIQLPLDVLVISARYGLVHHTDQIEPYDEKLLKPVKPDFADRVATQLSNLLPPKLNRVLILAPRHYIAHLPLDDIRARAAEFHAFSERMGRCQARLLEWLGIDYSSQERKLNSLGPLAAFSKPLEKGMVSEVLGRLAVGTRGPNRVVQWYARIGNRHIPVKRLVSALTDTPVSSFETCHALALLRRNGIQTCRVVNQ